MLLLLFVRLSAVCPFPSRIRDHRLIFRPSAPYCARRPTCFWTVACFENLQRTSQQLWGQETRGKMSRKRSFVSLMMRRVNLRAPAGANMRARIARQHGRSARGARPLGRRCTYHVRNFLILGPPSPLYHCFATLTRTVAMCSWVPSSPPSSDVICRCPFGDYCAIARRRE